MFTGEQTNQHYLRRLNILLVEELATEPLAKEESNTLYIYVYAKVAWGRIHWYPPGISVRHTSNTGTFIMLP